MARCDCTVMVVQVAWRPLEQLQRGEARAPVVAQAAAAAALQVGLAQVLGHLVRLAAAAAEGEVGTAVAQAAMVLAKGRVQALVLAVIAVMGLQTFVTPCSSPTTPTLWPMRHTTCLCLTMQT